MRSLSAQLTRLATLSAAQQGPATRELWQSSVMYLLLHDPFYGRVLSQLTSRLTNGPTPLELRARPTDWQLVISPARLAQTGWTGQQWLAMLRHTVLHLVWQHPERYAQAETAPKQAALVRWATDAAVNDYLSDLPAQAITSRTIQALTGQPTTKQQDSAVYWQQLRHWQATQTTGREASDTRAPNQSGDRTSTRLAKATTNASLQDGHHGWETALQTPPAAREQWRQQVLATTAATLSAKQRGTLPGRIEATLSRVKIDRPLSWQGLLQRQLGQVPAGRRPAYGRFNRRQPVRMDLPGQIVQTYQQIAIFIDESGSMGNQEIAYLLGQLTRLLTIYPAAIRVYPFDTEVHRQASFRLQGRVPDLKRVGGGGTRFQAVFTALPRLLGSAPGQLVIILTDGYGERAVRMPAPVDVIWLLTSPTTQFSVRHAPGTVISLADDPQLKALEGGNVR